MAGEYVDSLVGWVLRPPKRFVYFAAALVALRPIAHTVVVPDASGQSGVHSDHDSPDAGGCFVALDKGAKPGELAGIKLVQTGVVEHDEIDVPLDPMIVGAELAILRVVFQPLGA